MRRTKVFHIDKRKRFLFADVPVEETVKLITYAKGNLQHQIIEEDGAVIEGGRPLRVVLTEAVNGELHKISPLTGKQYTFSLKHLEHADPDTTYVLPHFGIRALPEVDGTPVRLVLEDVDGTQRVLLSP